MFRLIKKVFFIGLTILSSFTSVNSFNGVPLSCISMSNQACNSNNPVFVNSNNLYMLTLIILYFTLLVLK